MLIVVVVLVVRRQIENLFKSLASLQVAAAALARLPASLPQDNNFKLKSSSQAALCCSFFPFLIFFLQRFPFK